jgi:rare lipoprotein A
VAAVTRRPQNGLLVLFALVLAGCSGVGEPPDGKPLHSISAAEVIEPVPRAEPILAAGNTSPYRVNGRVYRVLEDARGYREQGRASWYGRKFHGRSTANGEVFNAYAATAAHRSLPIPSYVRVSNLENGRSMIVRVNDRGPFHPDRIIDLSYGAAVKLGFAEQGTAAVEVEVIDLHGSEDLRQDPLLTDWKSDYRYLQVGSFSESASARLLQQQLDGQMDAPVRISEIVLGDTPWFRVRVGPVDDRRRLLELRDQLLQLGYSGVRAMPD